MQHKPIIPILLCLAVITLVMTLGFWISPNLPEYTPSLPTNAREDPIIHESSPIIREDGGLHKEDIGQLIVLDELRRPIPGARVLRWSDGLRQVRAASVLAVTSDGGVAVIQPNMGQVALFHKDHMPCLETAPQAGEAREVVMRTGQSVAISFVDPLGKPVQGVSMWLSQAPLTIDTVASKEQCFAGAITENAIHSGRSDETGRISFCTLSAGEYSWWIAPNVVIMEPCDRLLNVPSTPLRVVVAPLLGWGVQFEGSGIISSQCRFRDAVRGEERKYTLRANAALESANPGALFALSIREGEATFAVLLADGRCHSYKRALKPLVHWDAPEKILVRTGLPQSYLGEVLCTVSGDVPSDFPIMDHVGIICNDPQQEDVRRLRRIRVLLRREGISVPAGQYQVVVFDTLLQGVLKAPATVEVVAGQRTNIDILALESIRPCQFRLEGYGESVPTEFDLRIIRMDGTGIGINDHRYLTRWLPVGVFDLRGSVAGKDLWGSFVLGTDSPSPCKCVSVKSD